MEQYADTRCVVSTYVTRCVVSVWCVSVWCVSVWCVRGSTHVTLLLPELVCVCVGGGVGEGVERGLYVCMYV